MRIKPSVFFNEFFIGDYKFSGTIFNRFLKALIVGINNNKNPNTPHIQAKINGNG